MTGRPEDWLLRQLPQAMLAEDFFVRFVSIFQTEADTLLAHADNLPHLADVGVTPAAMVREMGRWLGLPGIDASYPPDGQRRILRTAAATLQWRGTPAGLERVLELYSGGPVRIREGGGVFSEGAAPDGPAWVAIDVDSTGPLSESDFLTLVLDEVPASVRAEIRVGGRRLWPDPEPATEGEGDSRVTGRSGVLGRSEVPGEPGDRDEPDARADPDESGGEAAA